MMNRNIFAIAVVFAFAVSLPAASFAQPAATTQGPLVVEKIQNGWLFAPDVRATDLNGETGALAGGYLGRITDNSWVIGAGGYFLTNRDDHFKLAYGGPVVEWLVRTDRRIGFGVRAMVGAGSATLPLPVTDVIDPRILASSSRSSRHLRGGLTLLDATATIAVRDDFFVAEPQLNLLVNVARDQRIVFGLGYRAVGGAPLLGDSLSSLSGSIAYQIGGGR
jgi:hypothetical protein